MARPVRGARRVGTASAMTLALWAPALVAKEQSVDDWTVASAPVSGEARCTLSKEKDGQKISAAAAAGDRVEITMTDPGWHWTPDSMLSVSLTGTGTAWSGDGKAVAVDAVTASIPKGRDLLDLLAQTRTLTVHVDTVTTNLELGSLKSALPVFGRCLDHQDGF